MIKLTHVASEVRGAPPLFLIPGGPGLSSNTLRSLDILRRSFDLFYVDLPGTNGVKFEREPSFSELSKEIGCEISRIGRPCFILGHSFGGFFATRVALDAQTVTGLACLAVPFSGESQRAANESYVDTRKATLMAAEKAWEAKPSDTSMAEWLSLYGGLYFERTKTQEGRDLIANDPCSHKLFLALRGEARKLGGLLSELRAWTGKKLLIAGSHDGLLPVELLRREARENEFGFQEIPAASHFVMFDQPDAVADSIEKYFLTQRKETE